jgi:hypothetical protein
VPATPNATPGPPATFPLRRSSALAWLRPSGHAIKPVSHRAEADALLHLGGSLKHRRDALVLVVLKYVSLVRHSQAAVTCDIDGDGERIVEVSTGKVIHASKDDGVPARGGRGVASGSVNGLLRRDAKPSLLRVARRVARGKQEGDGSKGERTFNRIVEEGIVEAHMVVKGTGEGQSKKAGEASSQ